MQKRIFTDSELALLRRNRFKNLDLGVRVLQVLKHNHIDTIGKTLCLSEKEILELKGYRQSRIMRGIENLKEELGKIGLELRRE